MLLLVIKVYDIINRSFAYQYIPLVPTLVYQELCSEEFSTMCYYV